MRRGIRAAVASAWETAFKQALRIAGYDDAVMREHSLPEPSDVVIWGASALLSLVVGLGTAFFLWMALHRAAQPMLAQGAVITLGVGLALLGLSTERPLVRLFFVLLAAVLVIGYALGGPAFANLTP